SRLKRRRYATSMLWPRNAACGCLLLLAGTVAAQTPSRARDCYRGRLLPPCRSFWITEFGLLGRLNALPDLRITVDPFFRWEVGVYAGLNFGSVPGVIESFVLPFVIILSSIPET